MASEIIALELPVMPAKNLKPDKIVFPAMLTKESLRMTASSLSPVCWAADERCGCFFAVIRIPPVDTMEWMC